MIRRMFSTLRGVCAWVPIMVCLLLAVACAEPTPMRAAGGVLDLREWRPEQGPVSLTGEWLSLIHI